MPPADEPARSTGLASASAAATRLSAEPQAPELQRLAHQLLGLSLPSECVAGVTKCLDDLAAHIQRVREFAAGTHISGTHAAGTHAAGSHATGTHAASIHATATHAAGPYTASTHATATHAAGPHTASTHAASAHAASIHASATQATATHAASSDAASSDPNGPRWPPLHEIAASVRTGTRTAESLTRDALARIARLNPQLCAVTRTLTDRALRTSRLVDSQVSRGIDPGVLAGVPFGVKDLFDVEGLSNTAGAQMRQDAPSAREDAIAIRRLEAAGAVLVATLNMDAYAYGFVTDNAFHGITRNPHDPQCFAGGSSGGSAAAVAGHILPLTLGSDTNGSIRVPAALCGIYGLKPTHGGLPMEGVFPFVESLDDIGPFAGSLPDLKLSYEVVQGLHLELPPPESLRIGLLGGWFAQNLDPDLVTALAAIDRALGGLPVIALPEAEAARSAAFVLTAMEGGAAHIDGLRSAPMAYDPAVRDRLIAGALLPAPILREMQAFRTMFVDRVNTVFERFDVLLAPTVACRAPRIADPYIDLGPTGALPHGSSAVPSSEFARMPCLSDGGAPAPGSGQAPSLNSQRAPARSHLGMLTQPLSFAGLPIIAAPLPVSGLPLGLQLGAAPGNESKLFTLAHVLERQHLLGTGKPLEEST